MRKTLAVLLVLMMLLSVSSIVFARPEVGPPDYATSANASSETLTYLNLGDSIAYGMSAEPGLSYYDLYSEHLEDYGIVSAPNNFSMPGITSWELLGALIGTEGTDLVLQAAVSEADVITVSIGGNNLLRFMIGALFEAYGVSSMEDLVEAIESGGPILWQNITSGLVAQLQDPAPDCPLWMGSDQFVEHWPMILGTIQGLNPDAHVIALTIYNPIDKNESPEFHALVDELLKPMNQTIRQNQGRRSSVANVHQAFAKNGEAVDFSVAWFPYLDPHPNNEGHQIIFEELVKVRNPRAFR